MSLGHCASSFRLFNTDDPPLWTPLVTLEARTQAFRNNKGRCLNCHGTDHSFKGCPQPFINCSGCLNPHLGQLGDDGEAYRRWQQCMRSHERRDTRSSSSSDRRRNSSRAMTTTLTTRITEATHTRLREITRATTDKVTCLLYTSPSPRD